MIWLDNDLITGHSLYSGYGRPLSYIFDRDSRKKNYIKESIEAIDLDSYEMFVTGASGQHDRTVDAVIGICNERQGLPCNKRLLLLELRMKYKTTDNLSATQINEKDSHSRDLLNECPDGTAIDSSICLLFDPSIISQAESWNSRIQKEGDNARTWLVFSPSSLCNYVNAGRQMPYTPRQETINAMNRMIVAFNPQDFTQLEDQFKVFRRYLTECRNRYEIGECRYLFEGMSVLLAKLKDCVVEDPERNIERVIFIEDFETLMRSYRSWLDSTV